MYETIETFLEAGVYYIMDFESALAHTSYFNPTNEQLPERTFIVSRAYLEGAIEYKDDPDFELLANTLEHYLTKFAQQETREELVRDVVKYTIGNLSIIFDYTKNEDDAISTDKYVDNAISLAKKWSQNHPNNVVILTINPLVTMTAATMNPRLRILEIPNVAPKGYRSTNNETLAARWQAERRISKEEWEKIIPDASTNRLKAHEFIIFEGVRKGNDSSFAHIGRYDPKEEAIVPLKYSDAIIGISPSCDIQAMAIEAMMHPAIRVCVFIGGAGKGKTLLITAATMALSDLIDHFLPNNKKRGNSNRIPSRRKTTSEDSRLYPYDDNHIVICAPDCNNGDDVGAVPGGMNAKLSSKTDAILYSIREYLKLAYATMPEEDRDNIARNVYNAIPKIATRFIGGQDYSEFIMLLTEAQRMSLNHFKDWIRRAGMGTKVLIDGDPSQLQNISRRPLNSLALARECFSESDIAVVLDFGDAPTMRPGAELIEGSWFD